MFRRYIGAGAAAAAVLFAGLMLPFNGTVRAEAAETEAAGCQVERLALPEDADRLVVVEAEGLKATVTMYEKTESLSSEGTGEIGPGVPAPETKTVWKEIVSTSEGLIGRKGMGKTREGDEKTPAGLYKMNTPFGTEPKQEGFPENYLQVDSRYYWNGDSQSDRYNKLVNTDEYTAFDRGKSEHLSTYGGVAYHYCIDTGYNPEGTPYKGSALFLHCSAGKNTGGCIAIPEAAMTEILRNYQEGSTYILLDSLGNFEQYYG